MKGPPVSARPTPAAVSRPGRPHWSRPWRGHGARRQNDRVAPARTAVVTVDCHRGHLDPAVATMPVAPDAAARVVANVRRVLDVARSARMPVVHVILQNRVLPDGTAEPMCNPFWRTVEAVDQ